MTYSKSTTLVFIGSLLGLTLGSWQGWSIESTPVEQDLESIPTPIQDPPSKEKIKNLVFKTLSQLIIKNHPVQSPEFKKGIPAYERSSFVHWVDEDSDCQDTRTEVLLRDFVAQNQIPLTENLQETFDFGEDNKAFTFSKINGQPRKNCEIKFLRPTSRWQWLDPYTGEKFSNVDKIQIDHMVPLKHAYYSGAYGWSPDLKRAYANYLGNDYHLLAVSGFENLSKADKGPNRVEKLNYLPPNERYHCTYIANWALIKYQWQLNFSTDEYEVIREILDRRDCTIEIFRLYSEFLKLPLVILDKSGTTLLR